MNREGESGGPPEEANDNVIEFPRKKVAAEVAEPPEPQSGGEPGEVSADKVPGEESQMTMDAFERAVQQAIQGKLGDGGGGKPRGADELVAQVFSALTGKDPKAALDEVRARLSEPPASEDDDDGQVIDLSAVREARQKQGVEAAGKVGAAIKDTITGFLSDLARRQGHTGEITLDAGFVKQHGPSLLGNLFQSLAAAFMQQARTGLTPQGDKADDAPAGEAEADTEPGADPEPSVSPVQKPVGQPASSSSSAGPDAPPRPASPAAPVQVRLDLGSLFSGLFKRMVKPPSPPSGSAPKDPETPSPPDPHNPDEPR